MVRGQTAISTCELVTRRKAAALPRMLSDTSSLGIPIDLIHVVL
jgi:hypothetical protein